MTNQLASLAQRDYFYLDPFWSVNLGMYIINLIPKWPPFKYSFVFIQISPWCLVLKLKIQKNILSWTRQQGPICIRINQRPFWNKVYWSAKRSLENNTFSRCVISRRGSSVLDVHKYRVNKYLNRHFRFGAIRHLKLEYMAITCTCYSCTNLKRMQL